MSEQNLPGNPQHAIEYNAGRAQLGETSEPASTKDVAASEAQSVGQDAKSSASDVAGTAQEQAGQVVQEATDQVKMLLEQLRSELTGHTSGQQQRLAGGLRSLADELASMADGAKDSEGPGLAGDLARQASSRARSAASFMENREPSDVVEEVRRFARQRPGTFLAAAAVVGLLAGRLTRGVADEARDQQPSGGQQQGRYAYTDGQYAGQGQYPQGQYAPGAYGAGQYQQAPYGQYPQQSYGELHHGQYGQTPYGQAQYGQSQYGHEGVSPRTGQQGQSPREGAPGPYAATSQSPQAAYESAREGAIDPQTGMPIEGTTGRMEDRS